MSSLLIVPYSLFQSPPPGDNNYPLISPSERQLVLGLVETLVGLPIATTNASSWPGLDPPRLVDSCEGDAGGGGWPQDVTHALNILMCHGQATPLRDQLRTLRDDELALFFEDLIQRVEPTATETVKRDMTTELRGSYRYGTS